MHKQRKPFTFKQFTIHQNGASLPVTTDACLFGALANFENPKHILDLGTGTGLLLHFMAQKYPKATLTGIDINSESLECASENLQHNNFTNSTTLIHGDFLSPHNPYPVTQFDAIISNPPFFENQLKSIDPIESKSKHFNTGEMQQFFDKIDQLLSPDGSAFVLLPPRVNISEFTNLHPRRAVLIYARLNKSAHLQVIELIRHKEPLDFENLFIRETNGQYTERFCQIMSPFYLDQALNVNQSPL